MNAIALGNESSWLILSGSSPDPPFKSARLSPIHAQSEMIADGLTLSLSGTPAEITAGLAQLEAVAGRARCYAASTFPERQLLRVQPEEAGDVFYSPVKDIWFETLPGGESGHSHGKFLVKVHFTRPNHFDGEQVELPLTAGDQIDQTGGVEILNHSDIHPGHTNSVLISPASVQGALPAPLRIEITNTYPTESLKDVFVGTISHLELVDEEIFHCYAPDFSGGSVYTNAAAIQGYYLKVTWPETIWKLLCAGSLNSAQVAALRGRFFRPILHFYNPLMYQDLRLKLYLQSGPFVLFEGEPIWIDPDYGYAVFPPIQIPPYQLLYEVPTQSVDLVLYGQHDSSASYEISFDDLILLPLDSAASYLAHHPLTQGSVLIDDNFKKKQITRYAGDYYEIGTHLKQGGDLLIRPGQYNRLIFIMANSADQIDIPRTASVRAYYRKRVRFL